MSDEREDGSKDPNWFTDGWKCNVCRAHNPPHTSNGECLRCKHVVGTKPITLANLEVTSARPSVKRPSVPLATLTPVRCVVCGKSAVREVRGMPVCSRTCAEKYIKDVDATTPPFKSRHCVVCSALPAIDMTVDGLTVCSQECADMLTASPDATARAREKLRGRPNPGDVFVSTRLHDKGTEYLVLHTNGVIYSTLNGTSNVDALALQTFLANFERKPDVKHLCPRGHADVGVTQLDAEIMGDVTNALHCNRCNADYIQVRGGRWFEGATTAQPTYVKKAKDA